MTTSTPHLLHLDSSVGAADSVSRTLTARAAAGWLAANPGGSVTYRDLAASPPPHLDADAAAARFVPAEHRSAGQAAAYTRSAHLIGEVAEADTVLLGLPLYNYGPPSTVKAWVDHLVFPGLSVTPDMQQGLLGGRQFVVVAARGGSYSEGRLGLAGTTRRLGCRTSSRWSGSSRT